MNGSEVAAGVYGAADEALGNLDHLVTRLEVNIIMCVPSNDVMPPPSHPASLLLPLS